VLKNSKKDGSYYWVDITIVPILDFHDEVIEYVAIRHEITELVEQRVKLQRIATSDTLTGLRNRYKLLLDIELLKNPSIAILDINRFNMINDIYGHHFGDKLIIEVAKQIEHLISRHTTKKLYRLHSDVFAILNVSLDKESFIKKIEHIVKTLDETTFIVDAQEIVLEMTSSVSFEHDELLATADMALKYAKKSKIDLLVYNPKIDLNRLYENNINWTNKIRSAIERDAFVPFYQPIVNNTNGKWEKYESLIRLIDEDSKVISPFFFLEIAKNTKYYEMLTKAIIKKSFETFANRAVEFSINLTIKDIFNPRIQDYIEEMLLAYQIGRQVVFEIVESEGIEDYDTVLKFILKVKEYGCKIAIDDFGTGYSNFSYIKTADRLHQNRWFAY
jgi:diguanylate cyclase (GGDEF)-like protein